MSVKILEDREHDNCCFYCSTTEWAFGPIMPDRETAEGFLEWLEEDARSYTDEELSKEYFDFRREQVKLGNNGEEVRRIDPDGGEDR